MTLTRTALSTLLLVTAGISAAVAVIADRWYLVTAPPEAEILNHYFHDGAAACGATCEIPRKVRR